MSSVTKFSSLFLPEHFLYLEALSPPYSSLIPIAGDKILFLSQVHCGYTKLVVRGNKNTCYFNSAINVDKTKEINPYLLMAIRWQKIIAISMRMYHPADCLHFGLDSLCHFGCRLSGQVRKCLLVIVTSSSSLSPPSAWASLHLECWIVLRRRAYFRWNSTSVLFVCSSFNPGWGRKT